MYTAIDCSVQHALTAKL